MNKIPVNLSLYDKDWSKYEFKVLVKRWTWENGGNSQNRAVIEANERKLFLKIYPRTDQEGLDGEVKV
jgi:hypothetical protein